MYLKLGDRSYDVCQLQFFLAIALRISSSKIPPNGEFCEITERAVKHFQRWQKLEPTGKCDRDTWNRLLVVSKRSPV